MKTKWVVVGLFLLGLVSAVGAALLVVSLQARARLHAGQTSSDKQVVVAVRALAPMTIVEEGSVIIKSLPSRDVPPRALSSSAQVAGKVLAAPMAANQVFTQDCLATRGSGANVAAALSDGMRAVTISLSDYSALEGLLYPGSVVDVLASFTLPDETGRKSVLFSVPLLQKAQVLAVGDQTVLSAEEQLPKGGIVRRGAKQLVTLMVGPDQARALQLASQLGSLSLAMRNPSDRDLVNVTPMIAADIVPQPRLAQETAEGAEEAPQTEAIRTASQWQVTIIRGGSIAKESFGWPL